MIPQQLLDAQGNIVVHLLLGQVGLALLYIIIAVIALAIVPRLVQRSVLTWAKVRYGEGFSERRYNTIGRLMLYISRAIIFVITAFLILHLFIDTSGLFTFLGLFTAAIAFSIRQLVSDYITGFLFLFEDLFSIGDDVEIGGERGEVEDVTLRTALLRSPSGETFVIPNGDIRVVRNYTRGDFSLATIQVNVKTDQLELAASTLDALVLELPQQVPALLKAPELHVADGAVGGSIEITLRAKTRYHGDDEARRQMYPLVQQALTAKGIDIAEQDG